MRKQNRLIRLVLLSALGFGLISIIVPRSVSGCSLTAPTPRLEFVLNHGLATLNPDCTLSWKSGVITDLSGNVIWPSAYALLLQYGVFLFLLVTTLIVTGTLLVLKSRRRPRSRT